MKTRLRRWHVALVAVALFTLLRLALPLFGGGPRTLTAEEVDALLGARLLSERLVAPDAGGLTERLAQGFATTATQPRLGQLAPDKSAQRAAIEPPLPRWLGALGIGLLPAGAEATNLERASAASALALALAFAILIYELGRRAPRVGVVAALALLGSPGVIDAAFAAGHGASALLVSALAFAALERLRDRGLGAQLGLAVVVGLALAIHPLALVLWPASLIVWAVQARPLPAPEPGASLPLPSAPILLYLVPVLALAVLVVVWPALWSETGRRLAAWLLDFGAQPSPPHDVLGITFDQASGRSAQAFTALLQWVAWTPLPLLALWLVGLVRAIRRGRDGAWAPIVVLVAWLVAGALDGGLFGGRNSLLALMWLPTAVTAAHGVESLLEHFERELARRAALPSAGRIIGLLAAWRPGSRTALVLVVCMAVPLLQSGRASTLGLARETGAELRAPVPLAPMRHALAEQRAGNASLRRYDGGWARLHIAPRAAAYVPAVEALREGVMLDLELASLAEADLVLTTGPSAPLTDAHEPPATRAPGCS